MTICVYVVRYNTDHHFICEVDLKGIIVKMVFISANILI